MKPMTAAPRLCKEVLLLFLQSFITFLAKFYYFSCKLLLFFLQNFTTFLANFYHFSCKVVLLFCPQLILGIHLHFCRIFFSENGIVREFPHLTALKFFFRNFQIFVQLVNYPPPPPPPLTNLSCNFLTFTNFVFDQLFLSDRCCIVRSRCGC